MRRNTKKRSASDRKANVARRAFVEMFDFCWVCGRHGTQCHEMVGGNVRHESVNHRQTYLAVCFECHAEVQCWPLPKQLALKLVHDSDFFDPALVCRIKGYAETHVSLGDIASYLQVRM